MTLDCPDRGGTHLKSGDQKSLSLILANAQSEFERNGYGGADIDHVACMSGVSKNAIKMVFPTKIDLLRGVIENSLDDFLEEMVVEIGGHELAGPLQRLLVRCAEFVLRREAVAINLIVMAERSTFPEIADVYYEEGIRRMPVALAAWLSWHRDRGALRISDATVTANMLIGMMTHEMQRNALLGRVQKITDADLRRHADLCVSTFLKGCAAK